MAEEKKTVLVVDDDPFISNIVCEALLSDGYKIERAADGEEALAKIEKLLPDLVIMDYMMPKMDGPQVCRKVKENPKIKHVPIIMVTAVSDVKEKVQLLESGAEDYIVKPFDLEELLARVKVVIRRSNQLHVDVNSITKLPGNTAIAKEIDQRLKSGEKFAVCYADLGNFKAFNDRYGFDSGNRVISELAKLMKRVVEDSDIQNCFLGHIGGDDFIGIMPAGYAEHFCMELINRFDYFIMAMYDPEDSKKGYILAKNRLGELMRFPIMRLRIAVVSNQKRNLISLGQISSIAAELKEKAKLKDMSNYVKDERRD
ncbi:MAG: response regulator [bacterium]|jgi:diguanylate cyclase (GGDEF)-like protein|nr:response regulator [bacterium]